MAIRLVFDLCIDQSQTWLELRVHSPPSIWDKRKRHFCATLCPLNNFLPKAISLWHCQSRTRVAWAKGFTNTDYKYGM